MIKKELYKYDIERDGFTQSLLTAWMKCPSMARAKVSGLYKPGFGKAIMFGSVYHEFMDVMLNDFKAKVFTHPDQCYDAGYMATVLARIKDNFKEEYLNADSSGKDILNESFDTCMVVVPEYFKYWEGDFFGDDKKDWVEIEGEFNVSVAGGQFRGKRDGVYKAKDKKAWLFETKTKSRFDDDVLSMIIPRDFQVLAYMLAWKLEHNEDLSGVLYNIIRKPQLRQTKKETGPEFMLRIKEDIKERPDFYFARHLITITPEEIAAFSKKFSGLTMRYRDWVSMSPDNDMEHIHECNSIYGACSYLEYCASKKQNTSTLDVKESLFSELSTKKEG